MFISLDQRLIAASADAALAMRISRSMLGERDWLLVVTDALNRQEKRSDLLSAASRAWGGEGLTIARVDGADIPLGLRDCVTIEFDSASMQDAQTGAAVDMYSDTRQCLNDFIEIPRRGVFDRGFDDPVEVPMPRMAPPVRHPMMAPRRSAGIVWVLAALGLISALTFGAWWFAGWSAPAGFSFGSSGLAIAALVACAIAIGIGLSRTQGRRHASRVSASSDAAEDLSDTDSVFISYSHKDGDFALELAAEVERQGHHAWIYQQEMKGGATGWAAQIVQALRRAHAVMLVASRSSFGSDQVVREMYLAMDMGKPIIPIMVEDADMPDDLLYILAKFQRHQVTPPLSQLVSRALASL